MAHDDTVSGFAVKAVELAGRVRHVIRVTFNTEGLRSVQALNLVYLDNRDEAFVMLSAVTPFKAKLARVWTSGTEEDLELLINEIQDSVWAAYVDRFMSGPSDHNFLDVDSKGRIVQ